MGTIAKGEITLSQVNDAYTVSLTPASFVVNADFNGANPRLEKASGQISVKRGSTDMPFTATIAACSAPGVAASIVDSRFKLESVAVSELTGWVDFNIEVHDGFGYMTTCRLSYTVVRETSMLDWILDWETNKTKIGESYIMTPRMFVGRKEDAVEYVYSEEEGVNVPVWKENTLTGVYIGPDIIGSGQNSAGIYGYCQGREIFHLNADGGRVGGWNITYEGMCTLDERLRILSEGSIISKEDSTIHWALYADGSSIFANGNVTFLSNGEASFKGSITSSSGQIGGWSIDDAGLYNGPVLIDAMNRYIGIASNVNWNSPQAGNENVSKAALHRASVEHNGGVSMYWSSSADYGMVVYNALGRIVQFGSINTIAGWSIASDAIYLGTKNNTQGAFSIDGITIGTNGLRGTTWNIDANGHASFANEKVVFNADGTASISGWLLTDTRLSTAHAALVSTPSYSGLFLTPADISNVGDALLVSTVDNNGGIYIYSDGSNSLMRAKDKDGNTCFYLSTTEPNAIGDWLFDHQSIYCGSNTVDENGFVEQNSILLSPDGLRGHKWKLLADGSATFANGNVSFEANGDASFIGTITAEEGQIGGWTIADDAIYLGTKNNTQGAFSIDGITIGTNGLRGIAWRIDANGHASFANGNVSFQANGNASFVGTITAEEGQIGGWTIAADAIYIGNKNNTQGTFSANGITIGTNGLRGTTWNIDANGHASFANGNVVFNTNGSASISGWSVAPTRFYTPHAILTSNSSFSGLLLCPTDLSDVEDTSLLGAMIQNGGLVICSNSIGSLMEAINSNGQLCFQLSSNGQNKIGGWVFDHASIYTGSTNVSNTTGFVGQNSILISTEGLRGYKWKLLADGSGSIAGGNIKWTAGGTVTFANSVSLNWNNISGAVGNKLTQIDSDGIYTGTISADQITVGTIDATQIEAETIIVNGEAWGLNKDGAGYLANKNIEWDVDGNVSVRGSFSQDLHQAYKSDVIYSPLVVSVYDPDRKVVKINKKLYLSANFIDQEYIDYIKRRELAEKKGQEVEEWSYPLYPNEWWQFVLPTDPSYIGKVVKIYDGNFGPFSRSHDSFHDTLVTTDNSAFGILGIPPIFTTSDAHPTGYSWDAISVLGGYIEFVGVYKVYWDSAIGAYRPVTQWICERYNGLNVIGYKDSLSYDLVRSFATVQNPNA